MACIRKVKSGSNYVQKCFYCNIWPLYYSIGIISNTMLCQAAQWLNSLSFAPLLPTTWWCLSSASNVNTRRAQTFKSEPVPISVSQIQLSQIKSSGLLSCTNTIMYKFSENHVCNSIIGAWIWINTQKHKLCINYM